MIDLKRHVIVGPSSVGKTVLLLALAHALQREGYQVVPASQAMEDLVARKNEILLDGRPHFAGTQGAVDYVFDVIRNRTDHWRNRRGHDVTRFGLSDGIGGALFPASEEERSRIQVNVREQVLANVRRAQTLIICLDASSGTQQQMRHGTNLAALFNHELPELESVVFCLTKIERYAKGQGTHAPDRKTADELVPTKLVFSQLTDDLLNIMRTRPRVRFAAYGVSAFGFIHAPGQPPDGSPNYRELLVPGSDETRDVLGWTTEQDLRMEPNDVMNRWQPFWVSEPFKFAAWPGPLPEANDLRHAARQASRLG